ncbi:MAG: AAA family ATPase [Cellvibrionales bacterium]|jgi:type II secretory pathway predicted ATPase ExeA|nr:AAA family ATPase [Cellvibrionales bacterium]MBT6578724.1 AAA family ATPase [Cellvibrionales bacterium]
MYQNFFGLHEKPFSIAPDPRYLYMTDQHREALAHLLFGIGDEGGFILLTGDIGTGKTTICRSLLNQLPDNADIAFIVNPRLSVNELLQSICDELGIDYTDSSSIKVLVDKLNQFLLEGYASGRNTILIIDEAQNLADEVLEQLRLLTNLETSEKKLLQLILLGQPELNDKLAQDNLRQLAQRVTARFHLLPLSAEETTAYIKHRLHIAGFRGELFSRAALKHIHSESRGVPRLVNVICDRSMLGAYTKDSIEVEYPIVLEACKEVLGREGRRAAAQRSSGMSIQFSESSTVWIARLGVLLLLIGLAFVMVTTDFLETILNVFQQSRGKTMAAIAYLSTMLVG